MAATAVPPAPPTPSQQFRESARRAALETQSFLKQAGGRIVDAHIRLRNESGVVAEKVAELFPERIQPAVHTTTYCAFQLLHVIPYVATLSALVGTYYLYKVAPYITLIGLAGIVATSVFAYIKYQATDGVERALSGAIQAAAAGGEAARPVAEAVVDATAEVGEVRQALVANGPAIGARIDRTLTIVEDLPQTVEAAVERQMGQASRQLSIQMTAAIAHLARQRMLLQRFVDQQRGWLVRDIAEEREALAQVVDRQRQATATDASALIDQTFDRTEKLVREIAREVAILGCTAFCIWLMAQATD